MNATFRPQRLLVLLLAASIGAGPALAAPPPWAGGGKNTEDRADEAQQRKARKAVDDRADTRVRNDDVGKGTRQGRKPLAPGAYFDDGNRAAVHKYYAKKCPPGLAKKNNGCLPPGQAKKQWQIGQPLPSNVVVTTVPRQLVVTLPPVPPGHRYVQVAGDVLLIAIGTKMVVDGINGLMSR